jgi:two-component system, OmpR family, phosphate regulon response regulator PhoB
MSNRLLILVADENEEGRHQLCSHLQSAGYDTLEADNGLRAHDLARAWLPAALILNVEMPGRNGVEICRMIREEDATRMIPVIMLSPSGQSRDAIASLQAGADDCITMPFSLDEFLLRLQALLRRSAQRAGQNRLRVGPFDFDLPSFRLTVDGADRALSRVEFKLLYFLVSRFGTVVERDVILNEVWPNSVGTASRTLDTHIKRLRVKLNPHSEWLRTSRGLGYEFSDPDSEFRINDKVGMQLEHS